MSGIVADFETLERAIWTALASINLSGIVPGSTTKCFREQDPEEIGKLSKTEARIILRRINFVEKRGLKIDGDTKLLPADGANSKEVVRNGRTETVYDAYEEVERADWYRVTYQITTITRNASLDVAMTRWIDKVLPLRGYFIVDGDTGISVFMERNGGVYLEDDITNRSGPIYSKARRFDVEVGIDDHESAPVAAITEFVMETEVDGTTESETLN